MEAIEAKLKSKIDSIISNISSLGVNSINITLKPKLESSIDLANILISAFKSFPDLIIAKFKEILTKISEWLSTWDRLEGQAAGQNSYELDNLSNLIESLQKSCIYLVIASKETDSSYLEKQSSNFYNLYKEFDILSVIDEIKTQEILKKYFKTSYKARSPHFKRLLKQEFFYFFNDISDFTVLELKRTFSISSNYTKDRVKKVVKYIFSHRLERFNEINSCYLSIQQGLLRNQIKFKDLRDNNSENFQSCLQLLVLSQSEKYDKICPISGLGAYRSERFIEDKVVTVGCEGRWFVNDCNLPYLMEETPEIVECFLYIMNGKAYIVDLSGKTKIRLLCDETIKISEELYVNYADKYDIHFCISDKRLRVNFNDLSKTFSRRCGFKLGSANICNFILNESEVKEIEFEVYWDQGDWYLKSYGDSVYYYLKTQREIMNKEPSSSYELNPLVPVHVSQFRILLIPQ